MITADCLKVTVDLASDIQLTILALYRLHSFDKYSFINELDRVLLKCGERNLMVIGDINLCILHEKPDSDHYKTVMASHGLEQLINSPTRTVGNSVSCIDHIFFRTRDNFQTYA